WPAAGTASRSPVQLIQNTAANIADQPSSVIPPIATAASARPRPRSRWLAVWRSATMPRTTAARAGTNVITPSSAHTRAMVAAALERGAGVKYPGPANVTAGSGIGSVLELSYGERPAGRLTSALLGAGAGGGQRGAVRG